MIRRPLHSPTHRRGFTVIELLVVIGIILVLAGLLVGAVQRVTVMGMKVKTVTEVDQLSMACTRFKTEMGVYPPQSFTIPQRTTDTGHAFFKTLFPRWNPGVQMDGVTYLTTDAPANGGTSLNANQCLVYFLGGPTGTGWHTNRPFAPTSATSTSKKGPFFDFQPKQLSTTFPNTYVDVWGTQYAYLRSGSTGYIGSVSMPVLVNGVAGTDIINPYTTTFNSMQKPVNPEGVQIISAGANMRFGPGGTWVPGGAGYTANENGGDDLANFNGGAQLSANP